MNEQHSPKPKAGLHQTVRNIASARLEFGLQLAAVEYLRHAAECVSPDDLKDGRTPYCYERVDDIAHHLDVDPRTVHNIEKQLHGLGLIDKKTMANGHRGAKRCRRTGELLWVHGISLAPLIERREELAAIATAAADRQRAYRAMRQQVHASRARLKETLIAASEVPSLVDLRTQMWAIYDASPARVTRRAHDLDDLGRIRAELALAVETLAEALAALDSASSEAGDNRLEAVDISDASEIHCRHKYLTTPSLLYSCKGAKPPVSGKFSGCNDPSGNMSGLEIKGAESQTAHNPQNRPASKNPLPQMTASALLDLAPDRWREVLDGMERVDWSVIGFVAAARRAELGVSETAWRAGIDRMGPRSAALCLAILDTNRDHPTKPVRSVGGAFVAMTRRAEAGELNLEPSIRWIAARRAGVVPRPAGQADA